MPRVISLQIQYVPELYNECFTDTIPPLFFTLSTIQIRLVVGKFVLVVFKFLCRLRLIALDSIVGNCC